MKSKEKIIFDKSAFIPDRYFSQKSVLLHFKDIYKDKGRVLPLIAPVRHHMEIAETKNLQRIQNASKTLLKDHHFSRHSLLRKKQNSKESLEEVSQVLDDQSLDQTLGSSFQEDSEDEDRNDSLDETREPGSNETTMIEGDKKKKDKMENSLDQVISIENNFYDDYFGFGREEQKEKKTKKQLTALEKVEKSKEILRTLETPFEIYNRCTELTKVRGRNTTDANYDQNKLRQIAKKLDLVMDIGNNVNNNRSAQALNEFKKVPIQYFHKYRKIHQRNLAKNKPLTRDAIFVDSRDRDSAASQVHLDFQGGSRKDSSFANLSTLEANNNTLADEIVFRYDPHDSSKPISAIKDFKRQMSINWDIDHTELTQHFQDTFFSPLHECVDKLQKDPSALNIFPKNLRKVSFGPRAVIKQVRSRSESKGPEKIANLKNKVRFLDYNIANFKRVNTQNIAIVNHYNKSMKRDAEILRNKRLGAERMDKEKEIDQDHYEDAVQAKKLKQAEMGFNRAASQVQVSNKKERNVENVKFEKHIAKVEKKILERARLKLALITSLKGSMSRLKTEGSLDPSSKH